MGASGSNCLTPQSSNSELDKKLEEERALNQHVKKMLLLGVAGAGKSTLLRQLQVIYGSGHTEYDRKLCIIKVDKQIVTEMQKALDVYIGYHHRIAQKSSGKLCNVPLCNLSGRDANSDEYEDELELWDDLELKCDMLDEAALKEASKVYEYRLTRNTGRLAPEIMDAIKNTWAQPIIKEIYHNRTITGLEETSLFFWDRIDELRKKDYVPTTEHILLCRSETTQVIEKRFFVNGEYVHFIDVGGQKSEQRKWIHCFDHMTVIIFLASLSCYDEISDEGSGRYNVMCDQIQVFDKMIKHPHLKNVAKILFLNKDDLFVQKYEVDKVPLSKCAYFEESAQQHWTTQESRQFISDNFGAGYAFHIYKHVTTATDKDNIKKVFLDIQDIIISFQLEQAGLERLSDVF